MCNFFSALIVPSGDVLWHWATDSHSVLAKHFGLSDTDPRIGTTKPAPFAKVELVPTKETILDPDKWAWIVDEDIRPKWLTDDMERRARDRMVSLAKARIHTTGHRAVMLDDWCVLAGDASIGEMHSGRIARMYGGTVTWMSGGTVTWMYGGTVTEMYGGTVTWMYGGTIVNDLRPKA